MKLLCRRALTLSEVILVIGLLATVIVALMTLFSQGLHVMSRAQQTEQANGLAREFLEQCSDRATSDGIFDGNLPTAASNGFPPAPYPAREQLVLIVTASSLDSRLRRIQVEVQSGGHKLVQLERVVLK